MVGIIDRIRKVKRRSWFLRERCVYCYICRFWQGYLNRNVKWEKFWKYKVGFQEEWNQRGRFIRVYVEVQVEVMGEMSFDRNGLLEKRNRIES